MGPASGPNSLGSCVRTRLSWVRHQNPSFMGLTSGTNSIRSFIKTQGLSLRFLNIIISILNFIIFIISNSINIKNIIICVINITIFIIINNIIIKILLFLLLILLVSL